MPAIRGLKIEDVIVGSGAAVGIGAIATIDWRGWLNRGEAFGNGTETFRVGARRVIAGLERGVVGMRLDGVRRLRVGPHLSYRDRPLSNIPADAVLNFEVKLIALAVE